MTRLDIAIVTHAPDLTLLATVLERLGRSLRHARRRGVLAEARLVLVDNGPGTGWRESLRQLLETALLPASVGLLSGHGNVGYGAGHNLALRWVTDSLNPTSSHTPFPRVGEGGGGGEGERLPDA